MAKTLRIDTSDNKKISVELEINGKKNKLIKEATLLRSEATLPAIDKLLRNSKSKIEEIEKVEVNKGPGSFTGLRVGVAIANALSFLLKIPVNGKKVGELEEPVYNK
ncbi:MAG TPA: tRNA (adenosine(37)-N6)-threonylcarbamoyltransferase complex dimerization subunit type 1 TsaB [Patescibacteria group bacterium]|jgi:tRNA threonylcarbamoyladenosine biosynthesis protein TsaB|nr:tRNA (adenosine(37)-N6)-threonylcarbamoyltransferase complex dimerization subunit type 1 TsaB [Patescibacteria group bacterium]